MTYVVDAAVVEEQHHLTMEIDDLPAHGGGLGLVPRRRHARRLARHHAHDLLLQLPVADDELLLVQEEGVDLVHLGVEPTDEPGLLLRRGQEAAGHGVDAALELLVAQELLLPFRQALLNLPLQPLAKLHPQLGSGTDDPPTDRP
jgi:hypothetical protein